MRCERDGAESLCNMQQTTCDRQHARWDRQRTRDNMRQATCITQQAIDEMRRGKGDRQQTASTLGLIEAERVITTTAIRVLKIFRRNAQFEVPLVDGRGDEHEARPNGPGAP